MQGGFLTRVFHSLEEHLCVDAFKVNKVLNMQVSSFFPRNDVGSKMDCCSRNNAHLMSDWKLLLLLLVNHLTDYLSAEWKKHKNKQVVTLLLYEQDFLRWGMQ